MLKYNLLAFGGGKCNPLDVKTTSWAFGGGKCNPLDVKTTSWAFGAVGSASERHSEGHRFKSCNAHHFKFGV